MAVVVDASILIAILDRNDAKHAVAVAAIDRLRADGLRLPASAYAETLVRPFRRGAGAVAEVDETIDDLSIDVVAITRDIARRAAGIRARHPSMTLPDALVLATGEELGARVVTADAAWRRFGVRAEVI